MMGPVRIGSDKVDGYIDKDGIHLPIFVIGPIGFMTILLNSLINIYIYIYIYQNLSVEYGK